MKEGNRSMDIQAPKLPPLSEKVQALLKAAMAFGGVVFLFGLARAPERIWPSYLVSAFFILTICLSGTLFIALLNVSSARWGTAFRRVPEAMASCLPWAAGMVGLMLLFGGGSTLFEWSHAEVDPLIAAKSAWLNTPFFVARLVFYFGVWIGLSSKIVGHSRRQDQDGDPAHGSANKGLSALFLVLFGITFSGASFDLIMSLEAEWFSTIFGLYNFAGLFLTGLSTILLLVIMLRRMGPLKEAVSLEHVQDLATLVFSFSCFWAYLWFSQYMLIWYANLPEETGYYMTRHTSLWATLSLANLAFNWVIPFVMLLSRKMKRNEKLLAWVCGLVLVGHWLDLYIMVQPVFFPEGPALGLFELAPPIATLALFFWVFYEKLGTVALLPVKDPSLPTSLAHHV